MQNGAISKQARVLAAVSELDASPAPATSVAGEMLVAVMGALVPSDLSKVWLGDDRAFFDAQTRSRGGGSRTNPLGPRAFGSRAPRGHHPRLDGTSDDRPGADVAA